jgi:hypothetical protein
LKESSAISFQPSVSITPSALATVGAFAEGKSPFRSRDDSA